MPLSIKRTFRVFASISAAWLFYVAFFHLLVWTDSVLPSASSVAEAFWLVFFFLGLLFPLVALAYIRHRRRSLWIREEAERWLARRAKGSEEIERSIRTRRRLRRMLWVPAMVALSIFLFLPESMGLVSHLFYPSAFMLNGHVVRPPLTSFVYGDPHGYMNALVGRGIARVGFSAYWRMNPPLSSMEFSAQDPSERWPVTFLSDETAALERTFGLGDETISCWQISRPDERAQTDFFVLRCRSSKNDFSAGFVGSHEDTTVFYQVLARVSEPK